MTFEEIAAEFEGVKKTGKGFIAKCPVPSHGQGRGDRNPSLSITDGGDKALIHCNVGCDTETVLGCVNLKMRDLFYNPDTYSRQTNGGRTID